MIQMKVSTLHDDTSNRSYSILENAEINDTTSARRVVLMLHGWAQNSKVLQYRTKRLTKKLDQAGYDCIFVEAPVDLPPLPATNASGNSGRSKAKAWFLYDAQNPSNHQSWTETGHVDYVGLESSVALVKGILQDLPDTTTVASILGFSQGAVLGHILASHVHGGQLPWSKVQTFIFLSGFPAPPRSDSGKDGGRPLSSQQAEERRQGGERECLLQVPSLHVMGQSDTSVPVHLSQELASKFQSPTYLVHDKGHVIPQQRDSCQAMVDFLNKYAVK